MKLPKPQMVAGWEADAVCFYDSLPSVGETFVQQVFNEDTDVKGTTEVTSEARRDVFAPEGIWQRKKTFTRDALAELPAMQ